MTDPRVVAYLHDLEQRTHHGIRTVQAAYIKQRERIVRHFFTLADPPDASDAAELTAHLAVCLLDRVTDLAGLAAPLQLIDYLIAAVACYWLAHKLEESKELTIEECIEACTGLLYGSVCKTRVLKMEVAICQALDFRMSCTHLATWLPMLLETACPASTEEIRGLCKSYARVVVERLPRLPSTPAAVATAVLLLAYATHRVLLHWTPNMRTIAGADIDVILFDVLPKVHHVLADTALPAPASFGMAAWVLCAPKRARSDPSCNNSCT